MNSELLAKSLIGLCAEEKDTKAVVSKFALFLDNHHLRHLLPNILRHLETLAGDEKLRESVHIKTSHDFKKETIDKIISLVGGEVSKKEVIVERDEELIGGFVLKHGGVVYDGSLKTYLKKLKTQLSK